MRRYEVEAKPSWTYVMSQLDSIVVRGEFNNVQFEEQLIDFWCISGEVGWIHKLSQTEEVEVFAFASFTEPDDEFDTRTQVYGLKAGWSTTPLRGM